MKNVAILGASRGLGQALAKEIYNRYPDCGFLLIARNMAQVVPDNSGRWARVDLATESGQLCACEELFAFKPTHILYVAGGGPHGQFESQDLKSHRWALEVNYLAVQRILHFVLSEKENFKTLQQFAVVGSAIAGSTPDPFAASYAASKHALRGLIGSIAGENPWFDIKLYEPGYMDTNLLPKNSWPRAKGIVADPAGEAKKMLDFLQTSTHWISTDRAERDSKGSHYEQN